MPISSKTLLNTTANKFKIANTAQGKADNAAGLAFSSLTACRYIETSRSQCLTKLVEQDKVMTEATFNNRWSRADKVLKVLPKLPQELTAAQLVDAIEVNRIKLFGGDLNDINKENLELLQAGKKSMTTQERKELKAKQEKEESPKSGSKLTNQGVEIVNPTPQKIRKDTIQAFISEIVPSLTRKEFNSINEAMQGRLVELVTKEEKASKRKIKKAA